MKIETLRQYLVVATVATGSAGAAFAQDGAVGGEWRHHGGDLGGTKYSALSQIDATNFGDLEVAWRWESADHRIVDLPYEVGHYRSTPLMVGGRVFAATSHGQIAELDPATGTQRWVLDPKSYLRDKPNMNPLQTRGIEYWTDGTDERIFVATIGKQLVAIDLSTGVFDFEFGSDGMVDLSKDLGNTEGLAMRNITHGSPPIIVRDTIVVGSKMFDYGLRNNSPPGHVRAYDVRTGELKWRFNTIPQEGEPGTETWENESYKTTGNTNVWAAMAADEELGYVYLPTSTPTNDYWGGKRHGDNLYAESIVCLDAETGERIWHFQTVHHGIWDYDIASAPNLIDVVVDGRLVKAIAQVSKTGYTYVFDRATGEPVWPIPEKPVNGYSTVPGEKLAMTQPIPSKPPPFEQIGVTEDDLIDFTPELRREALEIAHQYVLGPIFTPLIVAGEGGKRGTLVVPGAAGGANWPGASVDPQSGYLYVESQTRPVPMALVEPDAARSDWQLVIDYPGYENPQGLPLLKPPYRRITAIDLRTGEHAWQIPHGDGPRNHPAIKHLDLGPLGSPYARVVAEGGLLVTKTLLITILSKVDDLSEDRKPFGTYLEAYNKATGEFLARVETDTNLHGVPMTYMYEGRQYIAIAGGGRDERQELVAFALPKL
ncbi:MAG: PQQ-binding-like beta-propeller repeat protein [Acidobacteriota bacterium]|nr:PQQ-binding-like beta-propeller repeat protein [Acidobacteriota bacterium]